MSDSLSIRREDTKLPSIGRHVLAAIGLVLLAILIVSGLVKSIGDPQDAISDGRIAVQAVPLPPIADTLNGASEALPDLLDGEVAMNVNPTEAIDALGNPVQGTRATTTKPEIIVETMPDGSSGPKTIMIGGKSIGGGSGSSSSISALPRAPIAGLSRMSAYGRVPAPSGDGRKPVTAYARPVTSSGSNTVSIIVGGLGVNAPVTRRAITELPPEVTLSFAAHSQGLQNWINQARARGHEVLIELPMESATFNAAEPGADRALKTDDSAQNLRNLDWLLSRAQGYFGVTNYNGDVFVTRADVAAPVLKHLSEAGLGFIFDGSSSAPSLRPLASSAKLPFASGFSLIDTETSAAAINQELKRLSDNASTRPIGVGFSYPQTIDAVKAWAATLPSGVTLAPASHALSR